MGLPNTAVFRGPIFTDAGAALFCLDVLLALPAWVATSVRMTEAQEGGRIGFGLAAAAAFGCWLLALYALGLYRRDALLGLRGSLGKLPLAAALAGAGAWLLALLLAVPFGIPRPSGTTWQAALFAVSVACFVVCGGVARLSFAVLGEGGAFRRRLMVVGAGQRAQDLLRRVRTESSHLHDEMIFVHHPRMGECKVEAAPGVLVREALDFDFLSLASRHDVAEIVIAADERRGMPLEPLLACKKAGFPIVQYLAFMEQETRRVDLEHVELGWFLYSDGFSFTAIDRFLKRLLDLVVSLAILTMTAPFLVVAALAVAFEGGGPILYRQDRVTRDGRVFKILKLRTMRVNAEANGAVWAEVSDPRITRVGRFLRRTRVDELPQLVNVLRGDMSIVGPRPERPEFVAELALEIPLYNERHAVKAGLTGWAQVNYPYGASVEDARQKLSYDLFYVKNFSLLLDLLILAQTLRVLFWPGGVR